MSFAHNALYVSDNANYMFNPAKDISMSPNIGTTTEPFVESFTYSDVSTSKYLPTNTIGVVNVVTSVDECKQKCNINKNCKGIAINDTMCYLKDAYPTSLNTIFNEGWDSYSVLDGNEQIRIIYYKMFGRYPTTEKLAELVNIYNNNSTLDAITTTLENTEEYHDSVNIDYIINKTIDPNSNDLINTGDSTAKEFEITRVKAYQDKLAAENAVKQTLLDETSSNLNYNVMSISIPLGIIAGYYLYKKNVGVN